MSLFFFTQWWSVSPEPAESQQGSSRRQQMAEEVWSELQRDHGRGSERQEERGYGDKATGRDCFENPASTLTCVSHSGRQEREGLWMTFSKGIIPFIHYWRDLWFLITRLYLPVASHSTRLQDTPPNTLTCSWEAQIRFRNVLDFWKWAYMLCNFSVFKMPSCPIFLLDFSYSLELTFYWVL